MPSRDAVPELGDAGRALAPVRPRARLVWGSGTALHLGERFVRHKTTTSLRCHLRPRKVKRLTGFKLQPESASPPVPSSWGHHAGAPSFFGCVSLEAETPQTNCTPFLHINPFTRTPDCLPLCPETAPLGVGRTH